MKKLLFIATAIELISGTVYGAQVVPLFAPPECAELLETPAQSFGFSDEQIFLGQLLRRPETLKEHAQAMKADDRQNLMSGANPEFLNIMRENIAAFIDASAGVRADWQLGPAMAYPRPRGPVNRMQTIPSLFGRSEMLDLDGKAYVQLRVYDAAYGRFLNQVYPVVKLSAAGNPVLLIHPDNHLLVPTVKEVSRTEEFFVNGVSVASKTLDRPVRVSVYRGGRHGGLFTQLIVTKGHRAAFAAVHRHEPLYIEIAGTADYQPVKNTWKNMMMVSDGK